MAQLIEIKASVRPQGGKGAARAARREGKVPAVIYGAKKTPEPIVVDHKELWMQIRTGRFLATVFEINVDGTKSRVIPRDVQLDPVRDFPIHVDFQRIGEDGRVRVSVPVRFINEALSPGLKRGGVLNVVRRLIEVTCPADAIPDFFEINLEGLEIGHSVHISAVKLPAGVKPTIIGRDFTVATIAGALAAKPEVDEAAAAAGAEATAEGAAGAAPAAGDAAAAKPGDAKAPAGKAGDAKAAAPAKGAAPAKDEKKK